MNNLVTKRLNLIPFSQKNRYGASTNRRQYIGMEIRQGLCPCLTMINAINKL